MSILDKINMMIRERRRARRLHTEQRQQEQIDAGYNLVYALMNDTIFVEMKQLSMQLEPGQKGGFSRRTLRAIDRALDAYGVQL